MGFLCFYSPGYPGRFWRDIEDAHPRTYGAVLKRGREKVEILSRMSRAMNQIVAAPEPRCRFRGACVR